MTWLLLHLRRHLIKVVCTSATSAQAWQVKHVTLYTYTSVDRQLAAATRQLSKRNDGLDDLGCPRLSTIDETAGILIC